MAAKWRSVASRLATAVGKSVPVDSRIVIQRPFGLYASAAASTNAAAAPEMAPSPKPPSAFPTGASAPTAKRPLERTEAKLNVLFWSKPCSLALAPDSPHKIEEPQFEGIKRFFLTLLLFYSKQSKSIRGANVVYRRIIFQIDKPAIYDVFQLEKGFKTTFSLLVIHMWLILRRLKDEGKEGTEFGQYVYEIYNHDLELRVSKAGVNLLLHKWMKDLEKIFYGNVVAYDKSISQEARHDDLAKIIWRNVYSEDGSDAIDAAANSAVQAMARYIRREHTCLSMTDKKDIYSGNFMFTLLSPLSQSPNHNTKA